jgi:hypothetical protein
MRTALERSAGKPQPEQGHARTGQTMHPLAHLQRAAGNQAMQRVMSGAPLPRELRASLESYFRTPLDRVRVHNDETSQALADGLGARAFTAGQNIHLGSDGARATGSARNELLAHEVVHTLQQGQAGPRAKLQVGPPGDAYERQADRVSAAFARGATGSAESLDRLSAPVIQRSTLSAHYGQFEDAVYGFLTDGSGANIGVEMYLKFHPGPNARSDVIALAQAAKGMQSGTPYAPDVKGMHQATSGPGTGYFIDQYAGNPNPLYAASPSLKQGGSASKLADYETVDVTRLTKAQQAAAAKSTGIHGRHYEGAGRHGYRKVVNGKFVEQPAELWDAPTYGAVSANSSQIFETAALALEGPQRNTYYGSVEWGWRTNAKGELTKLPFRLVSQGVPSVNFLTAATIWNSSRVDFAYEVTSATNMLSSVTFAPITPLAANAQVTPTGRTATSGATNYLEVQLGSYTGLVDTTLLRPVATGAETLDLPVPMVHTVSNPKGTAVVLPPGTSAANTIWVPRRTRLITTRCMAPTKTLPNHYEGRVVDGVFLGTEGFFFAPDLQLEKVGTRP